MMAHYEVRYLDLRRPVDQDAVALALRVRRDGDYFQFVHAIASGIALGLLGRASVHTRPILGVVRTGGG